MQITVLLLAVIYRSTGDQRVPDQVARKRDAPRTQSKPHGALLWRGVSAGRYAAHGVCGGDGALRRKYEIVSESFPPQLLSYSSDAGIVLSAQTPSHYSCGNLTYAVGLCNLMVLVSLDRLDRLLATSQEFVRLRVVGPRVHWHTHMDHTHLQPTTNTTTTNSHQIFVQQQQLQLQNLQQQLLQQQPQQHVNNNRNKNCNKNNNIYRKSHYSPLLLLPLLPLLRLLLQMTTNNTVITTGNVTCNVRHGGADASLARQHGRHAVHPLQGGWQRRAHGGWTTTGKGPCRLGATSRQVSMLPLTL